MPERIQRKRTKGFKLPENTVCVTRGTKWGNPFIINGSSIYLDVKHRRKHLWPGSYVNEGGNKEAVEMFESVLRLDYSHNPDINHWIQHFDSLDISELKGKNLACFCSLDKPCHADILLKLANA